jgi:signal transduction histidine kinase
MSQTSVDGTSNTQVNNSRQAVAELVKSLRGQNRLKDAIEACHESLLHIADNKYLRNILFDIYMQNGQSLEAAETLIENVQYISTHFRDVKNFGFRYSRLERELSKHEFLEFNRSLKARVDSPAVKGGVANFVLDIVDANLKQVELPKEEIRHFSVLASEDSTFNDFVREEKALEESAPEKLTMMLDSVILNRPRALSTWRIDLYCLSIYEKSGLLDKALKIAEELLTLRIEPVAVRSLLRICRRKSDYMPAHILFEREPALLRTNDFNVMYELVYYFEFQDDYHSAQSILRIITKSFASNLPALRTARNFYIRFGMIEEANSLAKSIAALYGKNSNPNHKYITEVTESETALASKLQDLYSQLEHQTQLAAISDLTTGISHELGQPLTNIRYTIQFYKRKLERNLTLDMVNTVFSSILEETERMGGLIRRLSPLTSSRGVTEPFDIMDRIRKRVDGEKPRIMESGVRVNVNPKSPVFLTGDPVKFDQLISNLLLNAIDAINERTDKRSKLIEIQVRRNEHEITIYFSDNGVGIPASSKHKIFDPFFSTKAPGHGEGLGLFIVWNLLKMLGGKISLDTQYRDGARFVISLPESKNQSGDINE